MSNYKSNSIINGLPKKYWGKTFANFEEKTNSLKTKKTICMEYAKSGQPKCLVLTGSVGGGKTHLAVAIAKNIPRKKGLTGYVKSRVSFLVADELFAKFNDLSYEKKSKMQFINELLLADLIIIDDLGVANYSPAKQENLYLLINKIYLEEKRMVLTTNFTMEKLNEYDPRITSRIAEISKILLFSEKDYRKNKKA